VRQGCSLSPHFLNIFIDDVIYASCGQDVKDYFLLTTWVTEGDLQFNKILQRLDLKCNFKRPKYCIVRREEN
jgi:hypothetical protein